LGNKQLYQLVYVPAIIALAPGVVFRLRDLQPNPPALVGRMVYENRHHLGIVKVPNPGGDCNLWKKFKKRIKQ